MSLLMLDILLCFCCAAVGFVLGIPVGAALQHHIASGGKGDSSDG